MWQIGKRQLHWCNILQARQCVYYSDGKRKALCTHLYQKFQVPSPPSPTIISERQHIEKACSSVMVCIGGQINTLKMQWMSDMKGLVSVMLTFEERMDTPCDLKPADVNESGPPRMWKQGSLQMFNETRCQWTCKKSKNDSWGEAEMWKQRHWKVLECLVPKCVGCDKDTPIGPPVTFPNGTFCRFGSNHAPITHWTCTTAVQPFVCGNPRSCSCNSCSHSVHYYLVNLRNYKMAH